MLSFLYSLNPELLNLLKYQTFRSGGALLTALIFCWVLGPAIINWLKSKQAEGQPIREDGPQSHLLTKKGTPTMGGIMILMSVNFSTLLWGSLSNPYIWIVLFVTNGYGMIGFIDDFKKLTKRSTAGLSGRHKLILQVFIAGIAAFAILETAPNDIGTLLHFPLLKSTHLDLSYGIIAFSILVMVGSSNAVNLTDGLDGLAIVPIMIAAGVFALMAYIAGRNDFANYLHLSHIPQAGEIAIFCAALIGAGLGFLWFNAPPAKVFMGDTGSLAAGGALGAIAVSTKNELTLAIVGGLFVIETLSVIIQVWSFKLTGKRVFKMAPIHHHFEQKGWSEPTIVIRFWIISVVLAVLGLATLKLR